VSKLDQEEREILDAFESGNVKRSKDAAETQKRHQEYAEAMFKKDARINIRLPSKDLRGLQKKALAEGIPYQTLIASILHKYVEGRLHENDG
jgi:predicted DNA binding CopG/RHH family protein